MERIGLRRGDLPAHPRDRRWRTLDTGPFASGLITSGRPGDIYGRKRLFLIGIGGFTVASALCGFAADPETLVASRVPQGGTAALMVPQVLSIVHAAFPPHERGKVFGLFGAMVGRRSTCPAASTI